MKNHKLFALFSQLNAGEKRDLEKYLTISIFNNRKLVLQLFQFLQKQKAFPDKTTLFDHLFPNKKYRDEQIRLCMSQLVKKIEAFLVQQYQQQQTIQNGQSLVEVYQQKQLPKSAERVLQQTLLQQEKQALRNGQFYFDRYELTLKQYGYATSTRTSTQNLQEASNHLDTSFLRDPVVHR